MVKKSLRHLWDLLHKQQSTIMTAAVLIMVSYGLSKLLGLFRQRLLVTYFYDCCKADYDAYLAAFRLPDTIFQLLVAGALSAAFIPIFSQLVEEKPTKAYQVASMVLNSLIVGFIILSIPLFIFAPQFSHAITGSFTANQIDLMENLTRWLLFVQLFFLFSSFMTGVIQSHHRFLVPALAPLIYNIGIIGGFFFFGPIFCKY